MTISRAQNSLPNDFKTMKQPFKIFLDANYPKSAVFLSQSQSITIHNNI